MTILTANEALLRFFQDADETVAVRDSAGNVVGFFAPVDAARVPAYARALLALEFGWDNADPAAKPPTADFDLAEAERQLASPSKGKTLDKIFEIFQLLTDDPATRADLQRHIEEIRERSRCDSQ
jgi:hypothetical protein